MKLVATSKLKAAQNRMEVARPFAIAVDCLPETAVALKAKAADTSTKLGTHMLVAITTDRGLCGSINSSVLRLIRRADKDRVQGEKFAFTLIGSKGRAGLQREFGDRICYSASDMGDKKGVRFGDVAPLVETIFAQDFSHLTLISNLFVSIMQFDTDMMPVLTTDEFAALELDGYEFESDDKQATMQNYFEWYLGGKIYSRIIESSAAEMAARMTSMDNATRNAGDMIKKLSVEYNRGRQASITSELSEIVAGAAAVETEEE
jgi:F-type H+-transporting ATPase subunit gamma